MWRSYVEDHDTGYAAYCFFQNKCEMLCDVVRFDSIAHFIYVNIAQIVLTIRFPAELLVFHLLLL